MSGAVQNAVGFLNHPKVKGSPTQDKVEFLAKKGLSKQQIAQAFQTAQPDSQETKDVLAGKYDTTTTPSSNTVQAQPMVQVPAPMPMVIPVQQQQYTPAWKVALATIGLLAAGGASAIAIHQVRYYMLFI
jgi:hypothetical protein